MSFDRKSEVLLIEISSLIDCAINSLTEAGSGQEYNPGWSRPRAMTKQQIQTACEQAYHWMNTAKQCTEELKKINNE